MTRWAGLRERAAAEEFAALLDSTRTPAGDLVPLVRLARSLQPTDIAPPAEFRRSLRERLVAEAAERTPVAGRSSVADGSRRRTRVRLAAAFVAVPVVALTGVTMASAGAVPGDPLYDYKRSLERVELALAFGDVAEGRELLEHAETRLAEAERVAGGSDPVRNDRLEDLLADWTAAMVSAEGELTGAYARSGDAESIELLDESAREQEPRLAELRKSVPPEVADSVLAALRLVRQLQAESGPLIAAARIPATGGLANGSDAGALAAGLTGSDGDRDGSRGAGSRSGAESGDRALPGTGGGSAGAAAGIPQPALTAGPAPAATSSPTATGTGLPLPTVTPLPTGAATACVDLPPLTTCP